MNFNRNKIYSTVILGLLIVINFSSLNATKTVNKPLTDNISEFGINDDTTLVLDSFEDFELVVDDLDIDSLRQDENITFGFEGVASEWMDNKEIYKLEFTDSVGMGLLYNCTDFDIEVDFDHSTTSSYWGNMQFILGTYYPTFGDYNASGSTVCLGAIGDAWEASGGRHSITGYPYNVKDKYTSAYGTLPLEGTTTIHMNRTGNTFICELFENGSPVLSQTWTEGMDQPINYITIYIYTGTTIPDFVNCAENLTGTFDTYVPAEYIEITDFSAFKLHLDNEYVDSFNADYEVYFDFLGSTNDYPLREEYILTFDEFGNGTYFEMYITFNYTQDSIDDALTFRPFVGSYYNYSGDYIGMPYPGDNSHLCGAGIWDSSEVATPKYVNIGYPNGVKDRVESADGAAPLYQEIITHFVRNESGLYVELLEADTLDYIESCYWGSGIDIPINYVMLDFYSGRSHSHTSVFVTEINGVICFGPDSIDIPHPQLADDPDMPLIYVSSPTSGTTIYSNTVTITWIIQNEGAGIDYFEIMLNEGGYSNIGLATSITYHDLPDGQYTFQVKAVDLAEQTMTYGIVFTIDADSNETPTTTTPPSNSSFTFSIPGFTLPITVGTFGVILLLLKRRKNKVN